MPLFEIGVAVQVTEADLELTYTNIAKTVSKHKSNCCTDFAEAAAADVSAQAIEICVDKMRRMVWQGERHASRGSDNGLFTFAPCYACGPQSEAAAAGASAQAIEICVDKMRWMVWQGERHASR